MDGVFRSATTEQHEQHEEKPIEIKNEKQQSVEPVDTDIEIPFTDYVKQNHHPFLVDYFKLGDSWQDKFGGFKEEIDTIEGYFKRKIELGEMADSPNAVKEKFKEIFELCKIDKFERTTMQIEKLAAYIRFLQDTDHIKSKHRRSAYV